MEFQNYNLLGLFISLALMNHSLFIHSPTLNYTNRSTYNLMQFNPYLKKCFMQASVITY